MMFLCSAGHMGGSAVGVLDGVTDGTSWSAPGLLIFYFMLKSYEDALDVSSANVPFPMEISRNLIDPPNLID